MRSTFAALLASVILVSCSKAAPAEPAAAAAAPTPIAPRVEGPVGSLLESYESMRERLASDDLAGALPFAAKLLESARLAADTASPDTKAALTALGDTAQKITLEKPTDIEVVRLTFGEVSKSLVAVLVADPKLREGRFLFECPMAKGYQKWVQTSSSMRNPYMGAKMLECGSETKWSV